MTITGSAGAPRRGVGGILGGMKKLSQNPVVRQAHRFREALLYPAYFVFSLLSLRWVRRRHPRAAGVLSAALWIELVMRGIKQLVRLLVPVLRDAEARRARTYQPR